MCPGRTDTSTAGSAAQESGTPTYGIDCKRYESCKMYKTNVAIIHFALCCLDLNYLDISPVVIIMYFNSHFIRIFY